MQGAFEEFCVSSFSWILNRFDWNMVYVRSFVSDLIYVLTLINFIL